MVNPPRIIPSPPNNSPLGKPQPGPNNPPPLRAGDGSEKWVFPMGILEILDFRNMPEMHFVV